MYWMVLHPPVELAALPAKIRPAAAAFIYIELILMYRTRSGTRLTPATTTITAIAPMTKYRMSVSWQLLCHYLFKHCRAAIIPKYERGNIQEDVYLSLTCGKREPFMDGSRVSGREQLVVPVKAAGCQNDQAVSVGISPYRK
jgi:hypothetical protein